MPEEADKEVETPTPPPTETTHVVSMENQKGGLNSLPLFKFKFMFIYKNLDSTFREFNTCTI